MYLKLLQQIIELFAGVQYYPTFVIRNFYSIFEFLITIRLYAEGVNLQALRTPWGLLFCYLNSILQEDIAFRAVVFFLQIEIIRIATKRQAYPLWDR